MYKKRLKYMHIKLHGPIKLLILLKDKLKTGITFVKILQTTMYLAIINITRGR